MTRKKPPVKLPRRAWIVFGSLLAATIAAEPFVHGHAEFGADGWFAFHAWYGFVACVIFGLFAKLVLGKVLSRPEDYYDG